MTAGSSVAPRAILGRRAFPVGHQDADVPYPLLSCLACHAFLRFVLGLLVCWCFCDRFVALSLLQFFLSIMSHAAEHRHLTIQFALLLHCSAPESLFCGFVAPDLRESRGSSAPADASAGSAMKKLTGPDASFPCALCGRTPNRHSQRTVFSDFWLCMLEFLSSLALRAGDLQRRELLLFSACLH